jgi:iduronate 2-sulfatase
MSVPPEVEATNALPDSQIADEAVKTLDSLTQQRAAGDKRPFFLAVGFHMPHLPFVASSKYYDYYPNSSIELPYNQQPPAGMPAVAWQTYGELRGFVDIAALNVTGEAGTVLPTEDVLALRRGYYAAVTQTDALIGRVLEALDRTGEADDTVISFFGDHGWQLGEHGEWCKHTNFEFAARAPMMVRVPGLTDKGIFTDHYTEHVDMFPTLTEAAAGIKLDTCPLGDESFDVAVCSEGSSLLPLMTNPSKQIKSASFSQYPRGYVKPNSAAGDTSVGVQEKGTTSPCIIENTPCTMGYTLVTKIGGHEYRYTEWADFNTPGHAFKVDWRRLVGIELYNHTADVGENFNLNATSNAAEVVALSAKLSTILRAGPEAAREVAEQRLFV